MKAETITRMRKLNQQYAYTSIRMHETVARRAGLSETDHKYLGFLIRDGQMPAGELARLTGLTTGAVTGLIDRFEQKQLVKRQFAENDRRKVIIVPDTDKIMSLLSPLYKDYRNKTEKLATAFSEEEMTVVQRYFEAAIAIMEETTTTLQNQQTANQ